MSDKFRLVMNAVDDDLLEEAFAPVKRKNLLPWIRVAIAACLMLVLGLTFAHNRNSVVTFTDLSDMGYVMKLPEDAEQIQYQIGKINFIVTPVYKDGGEPMRDILLKLMLADLERGDILNKGSGRRYNRLVNTDCLTPEEGGQFETVW